MLTTCKGIRRIVWVACLSATLALQGCISPTKFARPYTDEAQLSADTRDCAQWEPVAKGVVVGVGEGAMAGVVVAKSSGGNDKGAAAVAAFIALIYGIGMGAMIAQDDVKNYDSCMAARGYHPV